MQTSASAICLSALAKGWKLARSVDRYRDRRMQRRRARALALLKANTVSLDGFGIRVCIAWQDMRRNSSEPQGEASAVTATPVHSAATRMPEARFGRADACSRNCPAPVAAGIRP